MTRKMREIEEAAGRPLRDIISELYEKHGNQRDVAAALGINQSTLSLWLVRLGLEQRAVVVPVEDAS